MRRNVRLRAAAVMITTLAVSVLLALCPAARPAQALTNEALLDTLQHSGFLYFWNEANPVNGLVKDRDTAGSVCSIASTGFGLSAICVAIDHGWIPLADGRQRVRTTLETFWNGPQGSAVSGTIGYKGLYYHWLDMATATRRVDWDSELSTIDTALLFAGILDCKQYFSGMNPDDVAIRALADSIYYRADWNFMRNYNPGILMGWKPGTGFAGFGQWVGYNEAMILYILALGSPTYPVPQTAWSKWTSGYLWQTWYGYSYINFPPLFGHQYSHCWVDFRYIDDLYTRTLHTTYFENSRRATLAQREYCIANPLGWDAYSDSLWGITASDVPTGYSARGAPPAQNDDGTITPTAPLSSIAFAPEVVLPVAHNLWNNWRAQTWGPYGFRDAFNPSWGATGWFDSDVIGIDQGPIVLMAENYRTGRIWQRFMQNEDIQRGLTRAGFLPVVNTGVAGPPGDGVIALLGNDPNPFRDRATVRFRLAQAGPVRLSVHDLRGREVARLVDGEQAAGEHAATLAGAGLAPGVYVVRLEAAGRVRHLKTVRVR